MRPADSKHEFAGTVEAQTAAAVKFQAHQWDEPKWFPLSQVQLELIDDQIEPAEYILLIPHWLAEKEGVSEYDQ